MLALMSDQTPNEQPNDAASSKETPPVIKLTEEQEEELKALIIGPLMEHQNYSLFSGFLKNLSPIKDIW
jgi:hypothetical protein